MINFKLNLGRKELSIKLGNKRGRPKKTFLNVVQNFFSFLKIIYRDNRFKGNKISRVLRRVLEIKKIKEVMGVNLALIIFFSGTISQPISAPNFIGHEPFVYAVDEVKITTEKAFKSPLDSFQISQGYHFFHQAIDLHEIAGASVHAIGKGKVKKIVYSQFGYGNYLVVAHAVSLESLYAHLKEIVVKNDQEVDQNTILGTVGTSGWATGPHLHLEIHQNGQPINPLKILK